MSPTKKRKDDGKVDLGVSRLNLLFVVVIVLILFISVLLGSGMFGKKVQGALTASTDRGYYNGGNMLKLSLTNKANREVCFSSCPYSLQYKVGDTWQEYENVKCPEGERIVAKLCLTPNSSKTMGLNLPSDSINSRIAVPFCENCQEGSNFAESGKIYSNEFTIK